MENKSTTLLHVICDYVAGGMEFGEITNRLQFHLSAPHAVRIHPTEVPSLDTMAIGFVTAQYAYAPNTGRMFIYGNAAPRRDSNKAMKSNIDHGIKYARLNNGVEIVNVWSEFAFGFVKKDIVEFRDIDCPNSGSQFRSRDFFPEKVAELVNGNRSSLGKELDISEIPEIPSNLIAWTDGFGNIKTTMRKTDLEKMKLKPGDKVQVILNGVSMLGVISTGGFTVDRGVLAVNAGSSGYENPFVELFLRVHHMSEKTAAVRFDYPEGGSEFKIKPL
ncbi:MAG: SAM-dependent chlorinase/fluorinase [Candidatus Pacebacteria bacterium]|nr:SAM-dependent chlorinase/fluorinase [Candidatus Paceibacterota bacterium]